MQTYQLKLQHDTGFKKLTIIARDKETARLMACNAEGCPPCAIISAKELKTKHKAKPAFTIYRS